VEALTQEAFKILLFIIPGIISLRIKAALSISAPSHPLNATIDGLILTLLDHAVFGSIRWLLRSLSASYGWALALVGFAQSIREPPGLSGEFGRQFSDAGGFPIVIISIAVGFVAGVVRYKGWDFRLLRLTSVTNRTGENLVWAEVLTKAPPAFAVVACKDGSRFMGWIDTFSEEAGNYEVLLSCASQVQADGSLLPIDGPGVLLTRENPIIRVELWNPRESPKGS
jgi:hypothetical protein